MLITEAKFISFKKQKTKVNLLFSVPLKIDDIQLLQDLKTDGFLAFNADKFKKDVETFMKDRSIGVDEYGKSESAKLRGKIYIIWEDAFSTGKTKKTSEEFYCDTMSWIRNTLIEKSL